MQQGLNEFGLAFAIANMVSNKTVRGTSYICALSRIASQLSAKSAAKVAASIPLCSARFFTFLDSEGEAVAVETDGERFFEISGCIPHTNHFISEAGRILEGRPNILQESEARRSQLAVKISLGRQESIDHVFQALVHRQSDATAVVKFGLGQEDRTCAAFVVSPHHKAMWYTGGPPGASHVQHASIN
jgi:hypothetical protein